SGGSFNLSASIGIAVYPYDGGDSESLTKQAQTAMKRAIDMGRANYQFYTEEVNTRVQERLSLKRKLAEAFEKQEFLLHYQPVVDVKSSQVTGIEALVRWRTPEGKLVYPGDFILVTEDTGLIAPLDEWVLRKGCSEMKAL